MDILALVHLRTALRAFNGFVELFEVEVLTDLCRKYLRNRYFVGLGISHESIGWNEFRYCNQLSFPMGGSFRRCLLRALCRVQQRWKLFTT